MEWKRFIAVILMTLALIVQSVTITFNYKQYRPPRYLLVIGLLWAALILMFL